MELESDLPGKSTATFVAVLPQPGPRMRRFVPRHRAASLDVNAHICR
jgi:hypothetical protein